MAQPIVFVSMPTEYGWQITKNSRVICHYDTQHLAERAAVRLARVELEKGNPAHVIWCKRGGDIKREFIFDVSKSR